jgi:hypothetical protein
MNFGRKKAIFLGNRKKAATYRLTDGIYEARTSTGDKKQEISLNGQLRNENLCGLR